MAIEKVALIGLGALGVLFGDAFQRAFGREQVCFIADEARTARYTAEGVRLNGAPCDFRYVPDTQTGETADLILFTVKYPGLPAAIRSVRNFVGPHTILVSALNGVVSERDLEAAFGGQHLLYCTVQGMDATKHGPDVACRTPGYFSLGIPGGGENDDLRAVCAALDRAGLRYELPADIVHQLWSKFMLNVGVNQVTAAHKISYGGVQRPGPARDEMRAAMREAQRVAACEGVTLTDAEIDAWMALMDTLDPEGMTSMRQDVLHGRKTELDLFAGTVRRLGRAHGVPTPVNDALYEKIRALEARA